MFSIKYKVNLYLNINLNFINFHSVATELNIRLNCLRHTSFSIYTSHCKQCWVYFSKLEILILQFSISVFDSLTQNNNQTQLSIILPLMLLQSQGKLQSIPLAHSKMFSVLPQVFQIGDECMWTKIMCAIYDVMEECIRD